MSKNELSTWVFEDGEWPRWVRFWRSSGREAAVAAVRGEWSVTADCPSRGATDFIIESGFAANAGPDAKLGKAAADAALARAFPDVIRPMFWESADLPPIFGSYIRKPAEPSPPPAPPVDISDWKRVGLRNGWETWARFNVPEPDRECEAATASASGHWWVWAPRNGDCLEQGFAKELEFAKLAADAALVRHGLATMSKEEAGPPVKPSLPPTEGRWVSADDVRVAPLGDAPSPPAGRKDDEGKDRWDLLPWKEVGEVVAVLTFGAEHYGTDNWKAVPAPRRRYVAAVMRHVVAWQTGERTDATTGRSHLAHAVACLLFLMWFDNNSAKAHNEGEKP